MFWYMLEIMRDGVYGRCISAVCLFCEQIGPGIVNREVLEQRFSVLGLESI